MDRNSIRANGKLLITGEYVVMDGVSALALPTRFGQTLTIATDGIGANFLWQSFDLTGKIWFEAEFQKGNMEVISTSDEKIATKLKDILNYIQDVNKEFIELLGRVEMKADFPLEWGLGSSSTLIYALGEASGVDPYLLQYEFFGGSGYDIACAGNHTPIVFSKKNDSIRVVKNIDFRPVSQNSWAFVYLGKKQNSREAIRQYRSGERKRPDLFKEIEMITLSLAENTLDHASNLEHLRMHEKIMSEILGMPTAQRLFFQEFQGVVKSLGAWGGDFVLAVSEEKDLDTSYFHQKGFDVVIPYRDMIL